MYMYIYTTKLSCSLQRNVYFYLFTFNKVLIYFKILVVFATYPKIKFYTYARLLNCISYCQSSYTGV